MQKSLPSLIQLLHEYDLVILESTVSLLHTIICLNQSKTPDETCLQLYQLDAIRLLNELKLSGISSIRIPVENILNTMYLQGGLNYYLQQTDAFDRQTYSR